MPKTVKLKMQLDTTLIQQLLQLVNRELINRIIRNLYIPCVFHYLIIYITLLLVNNYCEFDVIFIYNRPSPYVRYLAFRIPYFDELIAIAIFTNIS